MVWRNTPTEGVGTSPAQRLLGRRCRTFLPMANCQLAPQYPTAEATPALQGQKVKQQYYYKRQAKDPPIPTGEAVRMRLPDQNTWTPGVCTGPRRPRSYGVQVGGREFRRNRRQLLCTKEPLPLQPRIGEHNSEDLPAREDMSSLPERTLETPGASESPVAVNTPGLMLPKQEASIPRLPRQSERARRPPDYYIPS